jgi:FKBP-type peptidyl-prolyl cis-trans isomerase
MLAGCDKCSSDKPAADQSQTNVAPTPADATPANELQITDLKPGNGTEATDGKRVTVHYTGTLTDGTKFDSSRDRDTPFVFTLGSGMVIAGWDMGIKGMKVGGVRKLVIPSHLAYGSRSVGSVIPPNATLVFEVELLNVEDQSH